MKSSKKQKRNGKTLKALLTRKSAPVKRDIKKDPAVLLIDGSVLAYMASYAVGYLSYSGREVGVIYGFLRNILSLAKKFDTNNFIFCWDSPISHRYTVYPQYKRKRKQKREKTLEDKIAYNSITLQKKILIDEILPNLGFNNNFIRDGYEGDDLLAYWALKLKKKQVIMVTSDADMYQCLDCCRIWSPQKKKFFTKEHLQKEFGVSPNQWAWAKAIGGCSGDEVIGIVGVSDPKKPASKALKYIQNKLPKGDILKRIESAEGQKIIKRNFPLVALPYKGISRMILRRNFFSRKRFLRIFDKLHFKSFLEQDNFKKWEQYFLKSKEGING